MRLKYVIRPIEHGLDSSAYSLIIPSSFSPWCENFDIKKRALKKRWGYSSYRDLGAKVLNLVLFEQKDGGRYFLALTEKDLIKITTSAWEYLTPLETTGTISSITGTTVTGSGTAFQTNGVSAEDYFILDSDHGTEPASAWTEIQSVDSDTQITLKENYKGTGTSGTYKIRKVYSIPKDTYWSWAVVDDKFCFANGDTEVQYWDGTGQAERLSTDCPKARYLVEYANRLIIADCEVDNMRDPTYIKYSAEGKPTDWTSLGSGSLSLLETTDWIVGLAKSRADLVVYKRNSIILGNETGKEGVPIEFTRTIKALGCIAPYSIVEIGGANAFIGYDDFYLLESADVTSIGGKMRDLFFDITNVTELEKAVGGVNQLEHIAFWLVNTNEGRLAFVWNWKENETYLYRFAHDITCFGKGVP